MTGIERIAAERQRQIEQKDWTPEHEVQYEFQKLVRIADCYATPPNMRNPFGDIDFLFPFEDSWWKPSPDNRIRELEKAGALIAAEIDRLQAAREEKS